MAERHTQPLPTEVIIESQRNNYWIAQEKYIMVFQDVRGKFLSEGEYEDMRPIIPIRKQKMMLMKAAMHTIRLSG